MKKHALVLFLLIVALSARAQSVYNVLDFGAKGDGETDDAPALQQASDKCTSEGGGRVLLPRQHTFLCGPLELKSNVELHLESTATLLCNPDESLYTQSAFGENRGEGMMWIWAKGARNLSITGRGTIHGNGIKFMGMELNDKGTFLTDLVETMETASGSNAHRIALSGTNNMLDYPAYGDIDRARQLLAAVEKKDSMYKLLKNSGPFEISVRIGSELGQDIFSDCSLVTATYRIGSMPVGTMGVIGPTRMPYGKVVSVLDYMSKSLGSILTNLLEED